MTIVVLAAGMSSRMGGGMQKLVMEFRGRPLVSYAVEAAMRNADTLLVTGFRSDEVTVAAEECAAGMRTEGCPFGLRCVFNPDYEFGQLSSVICGMRHAPAGDIAFLTGDAPFVSAKLVSGAMERFRGVGCDVLRTYCGARPMHPVIVRESVRDSVLGEASRLELGSRSGIRAEEPNFRDVLESLPALRTERFDAFDSTAAVDFDTMADFEAFGG